MRSTERVTILILLTMPPQERTNFPHWLHIRGFKNGRSGRKNISGSSVLFSKCPVIHSSLLENFEDKRKMKLSDCPALKSNLAPYSTCWLPTQLVPKHLTHFRPQKQSLLWAFHTVSLVTSERGKRLAQTCDYRCQLSTKYCIAKK